ncbi:hypothetical protein [Williamsia sterculiae]|nr:hypothetical protein [Williamsia sterculiae]
MPKLMYAVWGERAATVLRASDLRTRLADAGVVRMQLNLTDDPRLGAAPRASVFDPPVDAVVSIWSGDGADALTPLIGDRVDRVAGWVVDERRSVEPPERWDGSAAPELAEITFLRRPDDVPRTEWLRRWLNDYTPAAIDALSLLGELQSVVVSPLVPDAPRISAIVEDLYPFSVVGDERIRFRSERPDGWTEQRAAVGYEDNVDVIPTVRYLDDLRSTRSLNR